MKNTLKVTKDDIENGLSKLGVNEGDLIEVHSSLSSFGHVIGGAQTVLEAILSTVGDTGTVIMSAYPVGKAEHLTPQDKALGIHWKVKKINNDTTSKTGMGAIVDTFVSRNDTVLGQGFHRVCVWGKEKTAYAKEGYQLLYKNNGAVVLLGVGIDACSSLHLAEDVLLPENIENFFKIPATILKKYPLDKWSIGIKEPPGDAWGKVFNWARSKGVVKSIQIGEGMCYSFPIRELVDEYRKLRKNNPYDLFEVKKTKD